PQNDIGLPNGTIAPIQRAEYPANLGATETLLTSMGNGVGPQFSGAQRMPGYGTGNNLPAHQMIEPDLHALAMPQPEQPSADMRSRAIRNSDRYATERNNGYPGSPAVEPASTVRQADPC